MRYRYLVDLRRGISVFAIFSYGIAVLGTPQCPPPKESRRTFHLCGERFSFVDDSEKFVYQKVGQFW